MAMGRQHLATGAVATALRDGRGASLSNARFLLWLARLARAPFKPLKGT